VIYQDLLQGVEVIRESTGSAPICSAAPSWRVTEQALLEKAKFTFRYNSDCRGASCFYPVVNGEALPQPQLPTTLPTYDELFGRDGLPHDRYNQHLISLMKPERLNVLVIHAEVEGLFCLDLFRDFLKQIRIHDGRLVPLGQLLPPAHQVTRSVIGRRNVEGREGWVAVQESGGFATGRERSQIQP
jgi:undecaprenyl phosphate-alpha-L-ara4FN deformylase